MSLLASGVSVLTCRDNNRDFGMTISSLSSVGVNPPTVLVCVEGRSAMIEAIRNSRVFGVTILGETQREIGVRFADSQMAFADRFKATPHEVINHCPLIEGGLAKIICELEQEHAVSGNVVFLGRVTYIETHVDAPLVYFHRDWRNLSEATA